MGILMADYLELVDKDGKEYRVPAGIYDQGLDVIAKSYLSGTRSLGALAGYLQTTKENITLWMEEQPSFKRAVDEGMALGQMKLENEQYIPGESSEDRQAYYNYFEYYMTHVYKVPDKVTILLVPIEPMASQDAKRFIDGVNK